MDEGRGRSWDYLTPSRPCPPRPSSEPSLKELNNLVFKSSLSNELDDIFLPLIRNKSPDDGQLPYVHRGDMHVAPMHLTDTEGGTATLTQKELIDLHKHESVIIQTHNDILIDPPAPFIEFIQNLLDLDEEMARIYSTAEIEGYYRIFCEEGQHFVYYPKISFMGRLNPYRKHKTAKRSSSRIVKSLLNLTGYLQSKITKGVYLIALELTFPKDFSYKLLASFDNTIKKAQECFKDFYNWLKSTKLKNKDEELGLCQNLHLWSTKNPFEPHVHFHINIVNLIWKRDEKKFIRFSPKLDVDQLQSVWKEILEKHGIETPESVDVHVRFIPINNEWRNKNDLFRRFRYCSRSVILDFCRFFEENEFSDDLLSNKEYLINLFSYVNRRVNYGWFRYINRILQLLDQIKAEETDDFTKEEEELILKDLERLHGFDDEAEELKRFEIPIELFELFYNAKEWYCPVCGGKAKLLDVVTADTIDKLINKGIKYYKWDQNMHRWVLR